MILALVTAGCGIVLVIAWINFCSALTLGDSIPSAKNEPLVSVLVPARNEERSIAACLDSLVRQSYANLEIIVYDDCSEDRTAEIVNGYAARCPHIHYRNGTTPPAGWVGKNWACHNLSGYAGGEYLVFLDADVECKPQAIEQALHMVQYDSAHLLSCFPTQRMGSFGERCIVPLMNWFLLAFLPLRMARRSHRPALAAANGQFMFFEKKAYEAIGGHRKVYDRVVEDMELARLIKRHGYRCVTVLGGELIFCRMYEGFSGALKGFSKNFFAGFNTTIPRYALFLIGIILFFIFPLCTVWFEPWYMIAVVCVVLSRALVSHASHQSIPGNVILHPIQMVFFVLVGIYAVCSAMKGSIMWKGRDVAVRHTIKKCVFLIVFSLCMCGGSWVPAPAETVAVSPQEIEMRTYLRENFEKALQGQKDTDTLLRYIQDRLKESPELFPPAILAYYGSLQGLKAKYASLPTKKLHYLQACLKYLDQSVGLKNADLETYFLRFSSLHHLPPFFGIPKKRYEDIKTMLRFLQMRDYSLLDRKFQHMVVDFMLQSNRLNAEQVKEASGLKAELERSLDSAKEPQ